MRLLILLALLSAAMPASALAVDDPAWAAYDDQRFVTALDLAKQRAAAGDAAAHTLVGRIYNEGLGTPRDAAKAVEWYRKGADLGDVNAQLALGLLISRGDGAPADIEAAAALFEKAAAAGNPKAAYNLGLLYASGRGRPVDMVKAVALMEQAASSGEMAAAYDVGQLYCDPLNYQVRDFEKGARWIAKAAQAGLLEAQLEFAVMLFRGRCVPEDRKRAAFYMSLAAERGNPVAQNRLAHLYANGLVYKRDLKTAAKWHLLARSNGLGDQQLDLFLATLPLEERRQAAAEAQRWSETRLGP